MASIDDESIVVVQAICECSRKRAEDLLEAGGSVERAVDIHITQQEQGQCHGDVGNQIVDNDLPVYKSDSSLVLMFGASGVDLGMSRVPTDADAERSGVSCQEVVNVIECNQRWADCCRFALFTGHVPALASLGVDS